MQAAASRKRRPKLFKAKSAETPSTAGAKTASGGGSDKSQLSIPAHSKLIESGDFMKVSMSEFRQEESSSLHALREKDDACHWFRPLLLLIPLRLGQDKFNSEYAEALKVGTARSCSYTVAGPILQDCSRTQLCAFRLAASPVVVLAKPFSN